MRITLAYPYEGHAPDDTIELDDTDARRLLRDGKARLPEHDAMTVAELREYAAAQGIYIAGLSRKAEISEAIEAAEKISVSPTTDVTPASGEED